MTLDTFTSWQAVPRLLIGTCALVLATASPGAAPDPVDTEAFFAWDGPEDVVDGSVLNLRALNERRAGEGGFIVARDGGFVHGSTGQPVRFWAVNGPSPHAKSDAELAREARLLAAYGVNLVRIHGAVFDKRGETDPARVAEIRRVVRILAGEGIYTHLSIYFPLWFKPPADLAWLPGYDGTKFPFAALMFNPQFQAKYQQWWRDLLTARDADGVALVDEPALFGVEIQNEDSFFFWTFTPKNIPEPQLQILEAQFGAWAEKKHGSLAAALRQWRTPPLPRDDVAQGRLEFRGLWAMANERTARDRDTATFLFERQAQFYREQVAYLRGLGFKGLTTASNWTTANAEFLGPLEKASYLEGDFIDRHGYFGSGHKGEFAEWSIRAGHTYRDRRALRFETEGPGDRRSFVHPIMEVEYNGRPSMISETTWCRPNRHRGEAPLFLAAFGALQGTDAIVHFSFDGSRWDVQPNFWMQQWTLMTPAMMGQFPATALIYRSGLVAEAPVLADVKLDLEKTKALGGTPLLQDASLDELRKKDVGAGQGSAAAVREIIDPLIHFAGRTRVTFGSEESTTVKPLDAWIRRDAQVVTAAHGQTTLDFGRGLLRVEAPAVQAVSGDLRCEPVHVLASMEVQAPLDPGHVILVALDGQPLESSRRMLLQVMSEERATGFRTEPADEGSLRILDIGRKPWEVRRLEGRVSLTRVAAGAVSVQPLDAAGRPTGRRWQGNSWDLEPRTVYYLVEIAPTSGDATGSP